MTDHRSNRCPRCHHGYTSATHRRQCKGMTREQARAAGRRRSYTSHACSGPDMGRVLAIPAGGRIVADGSFYQHEPAASPAKEAQS